MERRGVRRTTISYSSLLSAFEKGKQWRFALGLLEQMDLAKVLKDTTVHNAAMSACEKCSQWQRAQALLTALPPRLRDTYSFNAVMTACANAKEWKATLSLLQKMQRESLTCDSFSYAASIAACGTVRNWTAALALFAAAQQQTLASRVVYNEEKISLEVFQLARRQQLFPAVLHHLGNLDLHDLSVGAASVALRWWLQVSPPGERLNVITGVGKNRRPWRDGDLQSAVAKMLRKLRSMKRKLDSAAAPSTGHKPLRGIAPNVVTQNAATVQEAFCQATGARNFFTLEDQETKRLMHGAVVTAHGGHIFFEDISLNPFKESLKEVVPVEKQFWGAEFGIIRDGCGILWALSTKGEGDMDMCPQPPPVRSCVTVPDADAYLKLQKADLLILGSGFRVTRAEKSPSECSLQLEVSNAKEAAASLDGVLSEVDGKTWVVKMGCGVSISIIEPQSDGP
eukprot:Skav200836  [mRNA]  locus=scaffold3034:177402:186526:- [translate_table: standard]